VLRRSSGTPRLGRSMLDPPGEFVDRSNPDAEFDQVQSHTDTVDRPADRVNFWAGFSTSNWFSL